jgi:hypothetical protein
MRALYYIAAAVLALLIPLIIFAGTGCAAS